MAVEMGDARTDKIKAVPLEEADPSDVSSFGVKGARLADLARSGANVPPGFIIPSQACREYLNGNRELSENLKYEILAGLERLERECGRAFCSQTAPLLLSVRSTSAVNMPGMLGTILNVGACPESMIGLANWSGDAAFAEDCYWRLLTGFARLAFNVDVQEIDDLYQDALEDFGVEMLSDISADGRRDLNAQLVTTIYNKYNRGMPDDPKEQLLQSVAALFDGWNNPRTITYRKHHRISHDHGAAVIVQMMAFGNLGDDSCAGIVCSRNSSTGEKKLFGEYMINAQGGDLASGGRGLQFIHSLQEANPDLHGELTALCSEMERRYRDVQTIEFTVERKKLYILQVNEAKRSAQALIKTSVDMVEEGLITRNEAIMRITPGALDQILHNYVDPRSQFKNLARGVPASPGAVIGLAATSLAKASQWQAEGKEYILVRNETTPNDIMAMNGAKGILTARGGKTGHAAVIARGLGIPAVVGCDSIEINEDETFFEIGEIRINEGDAITLDGHTGRVYLGNVPIKQASISFEFRELLAWSDDIRRLDVKANADTPDYVEKAKEFRADGIGLCRTEQMFEEADRLPVVRAMILADSEKDRFQKLEELKVMQRQDFVEIFGAMTGKPVVIRLLDPPLHEFLPPIENLLKEVYLLRGRDDASEKLEQMEKLLHRVQSIGETNPMLGLRGCRLGLLFPEIIEMQVSAILEAATDLKKENKAVFPKIMVPFVSTAEEVRLTRGIVDDAAKKVFEESGVEIPYQFGVMIEIPRAALIAGELAQFCDFFSFGTNDLTQMVYGLSRDDAETKFLLNYLDQGILQRNPFETLDLKGVGRLMEIAVKEGRQAKPNLTIGICGEHAGEFESICFCHRLGINYISCSPYRLPVARLAAAQAQILYGEISAAEKAGGEAGD